MPSQFMFGKGTWADNNPVVRDTGGVTTGRNSQICIEVMSSLQNSLDHRNGLRMGREWLLRFGHERFIGRYGEL